MDFDEDVPALPLEIEEYMDEQSALHTAEQGRLSAALAMAFDEIVAKGRANGLADRVIAEQLFMFVLVDVLRLFGRDRSDWLEDAISSYKTRTLDQQELLRGLIAMEKDKEPPPAGQQH